MGATMRNKTMLNQLQVESISLTRLAVAVASEIGPPSSEQATFASSTHDFASSTT